MRTLRPHLLLAGVLVLLTSGTDVLLPQLFDLSGSGACSHCTAGDCRCAGNCCSSRRCLNPYMIHAGKGDTPLGAERHGPGAEDSRRPPVWNASCSPTSEDELLIPGTTRPALAAGAVGVMQPGPRGIDFETAPPRIAGRDISPPTPPPRPPL